MKEGESQRWKWQKVRNGSWRKLEVEERESKRWKLEKDRDESGRKLEVEVE